jgi:hypothetical protein
MSSFSSGESSDSEMESYIAQVEKLKSTGTFGIFKEKLEERESLI